MGCAGFFRQAGRSGMDSIPTYVDLSRARLVAEGHKRSVYEDDAFPGMLIKVVRPNLVTAEGQLQLFDRKQPWRPFRLARRLGAFMPTNRELKEFLIFAVRPGYQDAVWPIQRFWGFVDTNLGLGLVVEKLTAPSGELAPTAERLVEEGRFEPGHREAIQALFRELTRHNLCVGSMHERNLVFVGELGKGGRFVGVDGLGDKAFIPLSDFSPAFNRHLLRKREKKLLMRIDKKLAEAQAATGNRTR